MDDSICDIDLTEKFYNTIGVITGDIVDSSKIPVESRGALLDALRQIELQLQSVSPFAIEIYRGDSFQIVAGDFTNTMLIAILIRAGLKMSSPAGQLWDARMSIGIGEVSYVNTHITASDGEAFRYSGRGLDSLGKRRLSIMTPSQEINAELAVSTAFADDIITHWTQKQSGRMFDFLSLGINQNQLAIQKKMNPQVLNATLRGAKHSLITGYLNRVEYLLTNMIK